MKHLACTHEGGGLGDAPERDKPVKASRVTHRNSEVEGLAFDTLTQNAHFTEEVTEPWGQDMARQHQHSISQPSRASLTTANTSRDALMHGDKERLWASLPLPRPKFRGTAGLPAVSDSAEEGDVGELRGQHPRAVGRLP